MSESTLWPLRSTASAAGLLVLLFAAGPAVTAPQQPDKPTAAVAVCQTVAGALLQREQPDKDWRPVAPKEGIRDGALLVALPEAQLVSANGAVQLNLLTDIGKRGPFPVLEAAVHCHRASGDADMEVSFDRGIAAFTNLKKKGAAKIRLRVQGHTGDLILNEPGTQVGMELYGRQAAGAPEFEKNPKGDWVVKDQPIVDLFLIVRKGSAYIQAGDREWKVNAPPGPAVLHWNTAVKEAEVIRLEKLPQALHVLTPEEEKLHKDVCHCAHRLATEPIDKVLDEMLASDSELQRRAAVVILGALDKIPRLFEALNDPKHADERDQAVLVLRHWVGRAPGQATKLYDMGVKLKKVTMVQAKNRLHLLYGFTEQERKEVGTYELLLTYLQHSQVGIRELARWHLVRLVPEGKAIPFDAGASPEDRARAVARWRALIPEGRLPPGLAPSPPDKK